MTPPKPILPPFSGCICGKSDCTIPYGLCHCGCGSETTVIKYDNPSKHEVNGYPHKCLHGHREGVKGLRVLGDPTIFQIEGIDCCVLFLTREQKTIVNARFYERLSSVKYCTFKTRKDGNFYAVHRVNGKFCFLHREILGMTDDDKRFGDHINGNTLDNRIENLRPATRYESTRNQRKHKDNRTGFKGVAEYCKWRWATGVPKWSASIYYDGKYRHLGVFLSPKEAHDAYCARAKEIHGVFFNEG